MKSGLKAHDIYLYENGRKSIPLPKFICLCQVLNIDFRIKSTPLTPEEQTWVEAYRNHDYGVVLDWLREEISGENPTVPTSK